MNAVYRRAVTTPRRVRALVFDRLPPAVRERLTHGVLHGAPEPILAVPSGVGPLAHRAALVAALAAIGGTVGLWLWGFGDLEGRYAVQPASFAPIYGVLVAVAAVSVAALVLLRGVLRGAPFRSGRYLFALDLVEVSGVRLKVTALETVREVEPREGAIVLVFEDGHEIELPVEDGGAGSIARRAKRAIDEARALACPADQPTLELIDPFFEVRVSNDWDTAADGGRRRRPVLVAVAAAALCAAPAGLGLWRARNALSDDLMFDEARTPRPGEQTAIKLAAYAERGHRHLDEVRPLFIEACQGDRATLQRYLRGGGPLGELADGALFELVKGDADELSRYLLRGGTRAAEADDALFALAKQQATLAAYNTYLEHGTRHAEEVRKGLLPDADYVQAEHTGLVGSLFSFVRRNPGSKHEDEAWKRIHAMYSADRLRPREGMPPDARRFRDALLSALEDRADTRVSLVVTIAPAISVADADEEYAKQYGARYLRAANRFSPAALEDLERDVRAAVVAEGGRAYPGGLAELSLPSEDEGRPRIDVHCVPVVYAAETWSAPGDKAGAPELVTPAVGFLVQVGGLVRSADGVETRITWRLRIEDDTEGKIQVSGSQGTDRSRSAMLEDAFARFFQDVPKQIAASFRDRL